MLNTMMFNMSVPTPFVFMQRSSRLLNWTRLVLFCLKNNLAHHLFNCNVAWFVLGIIIGLIHVAKLSSFAFQNLHIICLTKCLTCCFICLSQFNGLCLLVLVTIGHLSSSSSSFSFSHVHLGLLGDQLNQNLKLRLKKEVQV